MLSWSVPSQMKQLLIGGGGALGSPADGKAAFNNFPVQSGVVGSRSHDSSGSDGMSSADGAIRSGGSAGGRTGRSRQALKKGVKTR